MRVSHFSSILTVLLCIGIGACSPRVDRPATGMYRAVLELPGGAAPFGLEVEQEADGYVLYLHNGAERTRVPDVSIAEGTLTARFPGSDNSLRATMHRSELKGTVTLIKAGGEEQIIPLRARLGQTHRFFEESATDNADVAGRWEMTFTDEAGEASRAVAELEQSHDRVTGAVLTPAGDHRFLEGQVRGEEVWLSVFAGGLVHLYRLDVDAAGELRGDYWQGLALHERVHAVRNDEAELPDERPMTTIREDRSRLDFTFPDVHGKPASLETLIATDEQYPCIGSACYERSSAPHPCLPHRSAMLRI